MTVGPRKPLSAAPGSQPMRRVSRKAVAGTPLAAAVASGQAALLVVEGGA